MKSKDGWDDLIELTDILNNKPKEIEKVLNVDRALWMLAFNNVLVNLSSYSGQHSQNYYMYKDSKGHFNPVVWDLNLSFGSFKNTGNGSDLKLKDGEKAYFLFRHISLDSFKILSLERFGNLIFYANQTKLGPETL